MNRVPKQAASPTLSESSKKSSPEFFTTCASMTSTCEVPNDEENDVILQRVFPQFSFRRDGSASCISLSLNPRMMFWRMWLQFTASPSLFSSTTVVRAVPRLLSDVIERCSLMVKGDNSPTKGYLALCGYRAVYPAHDGCRCHFRQSSSASIDTYTGLNPFCSDYWVVGPTKHFTLLQHSAANASSAAAFIRLLPLAITEVFSTSPFLDDDAEDLHLLQSALAFLSRDLAVVVSIAEVNLHLLDHDAYLAASTLPLMVKDA